MKAGAVAVLAVGILATSVPGCGRGGDAPADRAALIAVPVRLVQVGGPMPGTAQHPVANGWIRAEGPHGQRSTVRTDPVGLATVELAPGTYTFLGRERGFASFSCRADGPVTLTTHAPEPPQPVAVRCIVP